MKKRWLLVLALLLGLVVPIGVAAAATKIPTDHFSAKGGSLRFSAAVKNAKTCSWSSSPKVTGFNSTAKCRNGKVSRSAKIRANASARAKDYTLTLTVKGKTTSVDHLKVVEAGRLVVSSTTSTTTSTTTTSTVPTTTEFTCTGNVTVTGAVSGVSGSFPTFVTSVSGTLTNGRNVPIYDVNVSFWLVSGSQTAETTVELASSVAIAPGATVSWSGNGPSMLGTGAASLELASGDSGGSPWVSSYSNDANGIFCGLDGFGSN